MNISLNEAKIILSAIQQCYGCNGFMDPEERQLEDRIKDYFPSLRYYRWNEEK